MSREETKSKIPIIVLIFIVLWVAFIAIVYVGFQNRSVIEYRVEAGVVRGEKTFIESRLPSICLGTIVWGILLAIVLWLSSKKKTPPVMTSKKPESKDEGAQSDHQDNEG